MPIALLSVLALYADEFSAGIFQSYCAGCLAMTQSAAPAWLYSLITEGRLRATVPGWLRPVSPVPSTACAITLSLFLQRVKPLTLFQYLLPPLHWPAPALRLGRTPATSGLGVSVPVFALHTVYRLHRARTSSHYLRRHSANLAPSCLGLRLLSTDAFHEYGVRLPRLHAPVPMPR